MNIIINTEFKTVKGEPLKESATGDVVTLRGVMVNALMSPDTERKPTGEEKAKRYRLAMDMLDVDEIELAAEDISKIKRLINDCYGTLVVGQAFELLESSNGKKE